MVWLIQWARTRSERNEFGVPIRNFAQVTETIYRGALPDMEGYRALASKLSVGRECSIIEHESREDRARGAVRRRMNSARRPSPRDR